MKTLRLMLVKNLRAFMRDRLWFSLTLMFPWIASCVLQLAMDDSTPKSYRFFCIIFCYWYFLNLGARLIISEKQIAQREFYCGLSRGRYLMGKFVFYGILCMYMACVFAVSVNVNWLNWRDLNILYRARFVEDIDVPVSFEGVTIDTPEYEAINEAESFQAEYQDIKNSSIFNCLFSYKRLYNDNGWGLVLVKDEDGWKWLANGSSRELFTEWNDMREHYSLPDRMLQQLVQLFLFDYGLLIFFLAGLTGLALGLCISAFTKSLEFAAQLVPYITLVQIVLSELIINPPPGQFIQIAEALQTMHTWSFGAIGSLFTVSRYLNLLSCDLLQTSKLSPVFWRDIILYRGDIAVVIVVFIACPLILAYLKLKRWSYEI